MVSGQTFHGKWRLRRLVQEEKSVTNGGYNEKAEKE